MEVSENGGYIFTNFQDFILYKPSIFGGFPIYGNRHMDAHPMVFHDFRFPSGLSCWAFYHLSLCPTTHLKTWWEVSSNVGNPQ